MAVQYLLLFLTLAALVSVIIISTKFMTLFKSVIHDFKSNNEIQTENDNSRHEQLIQALNKISNEQQKNSEALASILEDIGATLTRIDDLDEQIADLADKLQPQNQEIVRQIPQQNPLSDIGFEEFLSVSNKITSASSVVIGENSNLEKVVDVVNFFNSIGSAMSTATARYSAFSPQVETLIRSGAAELMASSSHDFAVAVQNGRIIGIAQVIGPSAAQLAMSGWNIIVSGAHMIAGHDNAKKLRLIDKKIDRLIQLDDGDRLATLEACYEYLRHMQLPLSDSDKVNVKSILQELRCLRIGWRSQLARISDDIKKPSWSQRYLLPNRSTNESREEIDRLEENLRRFHFSLRLEARALEFVNDVSASKIFLTTIDEEVTRLETIAGEIQRSWNSAPTREKRDQPTIIQLLRDTADAYKEASLALKKIDAAPISLNSTVNNMNTRPKENHAKSVNRRIR